jgi:hypothetical protein
VVCRSVRRENLLLGRFFGGVFRGAFFAGLAGGFGFGAALVTFAAFFTSKYGAGADGGGDSKGEEQFDGFHFILMVMVWFKAV